jgi:hypothetical protein
VLWLTMTSEMWLFATFFNHRQSLINGPGALSISRDRLGGKVMKIMGKERS